MLRGTFLSILSLLALSACLKPVAPMADGVCWSADLSGPQPRFTPLQQGVANMETCAVLLEALRLKGAPSVNGAFQGYLIFVDAGAMTSAKRVEGFRYPIFQPPQRAQIDADLTRLMKQNGGALPSPDQLVLERK
jgi:hypothetical protein